jgi:hypothetical protein
MAGSTTVIGTVGQAERVTQDRVLVLFCDELGYE